MLRARLSELREIETSNGDAAGPVDSASARAELTDATAEQQKAIAEARRIARLQRLRRNGWERRRRRPALPRRS